MRNPTLPMLAFSILMWAACDTEPPTQPVDFQPASDIIDAAHTGVPGFYWLPPMAPQPSTKGTFMGNLWPVVEVCVLVGDDCPAPAIRYFDGNTGVEVDVHGKHYQVNWQTDVDAGSYRISVLLGTKLVGYADIAIVDNGAAFKTLVGDVVGLIDGRTIPIKFRIDDDLFDIAYHSNQDANLDDCEFNSDVFVMNRLTGARVNLTNSQSTIDFTPSWSPDGTRIAFASDRANACGDPDIYIMDLVGGTPERLTTDGGWKPAWSPDGQWIAFQRGWDPENVAQNIWIVPAAGGTEVQLTDPGLLPNEDPCEDIDPTWHPDGTSVTFSRQENEGIGDGCPDPALGLLISSFALFSVDVTNLSWTRHTGFHPTGIYPDWIAPQWSPSGNLVAQWDLNPTVDVGDLVALAGLVQLTDNLEGDDQNPSWAPDGEQVIFTSFRSPDGVLPAGWGIYYVPSWSNWVVGGPDFLADEGYRLDTGPGTLVGWGKYRPGS